MSFGGKINEGQRKASRETHAALSLVFAEWYLPEQWVLLGTIIDKTPSHCDLKLRKASVIRRRLPRQTQDAQ